MVHTRLKLICEGLETNASKMTSSAKFIDYFVHDMLDYTVLTNDCSNFIKNVTRFDIRTVIEEIYQILEDKAYMKEIEVRLNYL